MDTGQGPWERISSFLERRSGWVIIAILLLTLLLFIPLLTMAPEGRASGEPGGQVFDLRDEVDRRFPPRIHAPAFVVEAQDGDVLTQAPLWELYQNEERLRQSATGQTYLYNGFDPDLQQPVMGIFSLADAVQEVLTRDPRLNTTLEQASDQQVKLAVHQVLRNPQTEGLKEFLSQEATRERRVVAGQEIDYWRSPALLTWVAADNEKLGGGSLSIIVGGDPIVVNKERFNREVQGLLRGDQESYHLWGVAIDVNLESEEEGRTAIPFIVATVIMVLAVVGVSLRSGRAVALTGLGLAMLVVWLKGISNLIGLKSSLILDLIVPIAMISLGVDFAIHALHRYREEQRKGYEPRRALRLGFAGVLAALALAMVTDGIAFFANTASGIDTVIGFGIAAGVAVISSLLILGIFVPLVLMRLDARRKAAPQPVAGGDPGNPPIGQRRLLGSLSLVSLVVNLARYRFITLGAVAAITGVAIFFALQLEPQLDVKEFFNSRSDFVVSLDKLDEHVGPSAGEPAIIYIQGDLTNPPALEAIQGLMDTMAGNPYVAKERDGGVTLQARTVFTLLRHLTASEYAREQVKRASGVEITDANGDGIPDNREQLQASYEYMVQRGLPLNETTLIYDAPQVRETLFHDLAGAQEDATQVVVGLPGTREQAVVTRARKALEKDIDTLRGAPGISFVGLTGSPFTRDATLQATTRALNISFPIAVVACLLAITALMRSLRFSVVTIIPIGLVVAWLYAFMYLAGFHLNFVTATIAAVSIGVGIDYSIHMTQRFREELRRTGERLLALRQAAQGTGVALMGSAASSIFGFAIMGFAPMPMFSAYGIITATMIFLAAAAALLVLPSLLLLVTPMRAARS